METRTSTARRRSCSPSYGAQVWWIVTLALTAAGRGLADTLLGMEFDQETGEELFKGLVPARENIVAELQRLSELESEPRVVLIGGQGSGNKDPLVVYQTGSSEDDLPECKEKNEVCSKVDLYAKPWLERQCRCPSGRTCSRSIHADDGHTIADKTRQFKICEPVKRLPICRYFKEVSWTVAPNAGPNNASVQKINCRCRPGSVSYLQKRQHYIKPDGKGDYIFLFACSPQSRLKCRPKEPCRLFTVHEKDTGVEEVNASPLCGCSRGHRCPRRHTDPGAIASSYYGGNQKVRIYSGHCVPARHPGAGKNGNNGNNGNNNNNNAAAGTVNRNKYRYDLGPGY